MRKPRTPRSFPSISFLEAIVIAEAISHFAAGQRIRRLTLFENMKRSAESSTSRQLVTASAQYKLTIGSYSADYLELTPEGKLAAGDPSLGVTRLAARLQLAIAEVAPFNKIYEQFKDNRLPQSSVLKDFARDNALVPDEHVDECVETFLVNARDLGLLRTYAGAERLLTLELALDEYGDNTSADTSSSETPPEPEPRQVGLIVAPTKDGVRTRPSEIIAGASNLENVCFLITPIGGDDSEQRKHADLVFGSLIEPALTELGLRLVRADRISSPGMITSQVIEHIVKSKLVIADLSFGNPNVFYELALRHATRKPAVQLIRKGDKLPFDVGQFRTIQIDMTDIFTFVPQLDLHRSEIARQCRLALDAGGEAESPLSRFYPNFWDSIQAVN
jgi:hypothetical protein